MPLILLILALGLLKYFEVWKFADMSWWYVVGAMGFAFVWFEFIEKIFGLDKEKDTADVDAERRKKRIQETFDKNNKKGRR